jgi:hypothetical protein
VGKKLPKVSIGSSFGGTGATKLGLNEKSAAVVVGFGCGGCSCDGLELFCAGDPPRVDGYVQVSRQQSCERSKRILSFEQMKRYYFLGMIRNEELNSPFLKEVPRCRLSLLGS